MECWKEMSKAPNVWHDGRNWKFKRSEKEVENETDMKNNEILRKKMREKF